MIALPFIILLSYMYSMLFFSKDFAFGVLVLSGIVGISLAIVMDKTRLRKVDPEITDDGVDQIGATFPEPCVALLAPLAGVGSKEIHPTSVPP